MANLKVGIILGSVRQGRNAEAVTNWMYDFAVKRNDGVDYEIVDLADYQLPLLGAQVPEVIQAESEAAIKAWSEKMTSFDGYVFVADRKSVV